MFLLKLLLVMSQVLSRTTVLLYVPPLVYMVPNYLIRHSGGVTRRRGSGVWALAACGVTNKTD